MIRPKTYPTEYFAIVFSPSRHGKKDYKFSDNEKQQILDSVKRLEDFLFKMLTFSVQTKKIIYKIPVIFEKLKDTTYKKKYPHKFAMVQEIPPGAQYGNISVRGSTTLVMLCPNYQEEIDKTISHELFHAFMNSFIEGINAQNKEFFLEGLTEFIAVLSSSV